MGLGAAILAASRPYEGGAMCLGVGGVALAWLAGKHRPPLGSALLRLVVPMVLMLSLTVGGICFYFYRVTGSPFGLPEKIQREPYAMAPIFLWQSAGPGSRFIVTRRCTIFTPSGK